MLTYRPISIFHAFRRRLVEDAGRLKRFWPDMPWHSLLLAVAPILMLFAHNRQRLELSALLVPICLSLIAVIALLYIGRFLLRDWEKSATLTSAIILAFFTYGYIKQFLEQYVDKFINITQSSFGEDKILYSALLFLCSWLAWYVIRAKNGLETQTRFLNVFAVVLLIFPLLQVSALALGKLSSDSEAGEVGHIEAAKADSDRNIYYIVPEDYASNTILKDSFHFDNSQFTNFLEQQGFYVAGHSMTNYAMSSLSLASTLNLNYLQTFKPQVADSRPEVSTVFPLLQSHIVGRFLQQQGYTYIHMSSWYSPTQTNAIADEVINYSNDRFGLSRFQRLLLNQSLIAPLLDKTLPLSDFQQQLTGAEYEFKAFPDVIAQPGPKFVLAHIIMPHGPSVYDAKCDVVNDAIVRARSQAEDYLQQLQCVNTRLEDVIGSIRQQDPDAIIVLQSDEGAPGIAIGMQNEDDFEHSTLSERQQRTGMLAAYYFPDGGDKVLYPSVSPVNSFRLLFNYYFGTHYDQLPDKTYLPADTGHLFDFIDATQQLGR